MFQRGDKITIASRQKVSKIAEKDYKGTYRVTGDSVCMNHTMCTLAGSTFIIEKISFFQGRPLYTLDNADFKWRDWMFEDKIIVIPLNN